MTSLFVEERESNVKSPAVYVTRDIEDIKSFFDLLGKGITRKAKDGSLFFSQSDSNFLKFTNSFGWKKDAPYFELEFVDPDQSFISQFLLRHARLKNAYQHLSKVYITYGIGTNANDWSEPQAIYLWRITVNLQARGARKYTMYFGPTPSLMNSGKLRSRKLDDRNLVTFGAATWGSQTTKTGPFNLPDKRGAVAHRIAGSPRGGDDSIIERIDTALSLCLTTYIENITNSKGNVVVLLPSIALTSISDRVMDPDAEWNYTPPTGHTVPPPPALLDQVLKGALHGAPHIRIGDVLDILGEDFNRFRGFHDYAVVNEDDNDYWKHPLNYKSMIFQATSDSVTDKQHGSNEFVEVDWKKPLKDFSDWYLDRLHSTYIKKISNEKGIVPGAPEDLPGVTAVNPSPVLEPYMSDVRSSIRHFYSGWDTMVSFDDFFITDLDKLSILKEQGIIESAEKPCFVWGEANLINWFFGFSKKTPRPVVVATPVETEERKALYSASHKYPRSLLAGYSNLYDECELSNLKAIGDSFINNEFIDKFSAKKIEREAKAINPDGILDLGAYDAIALGLSELTGQQRSVTHLQVAQGVPLIPVLKSNVRGSNITDLDIDINPVFWAQLIGIAASETYRLSKDQTTLVLSEIKEAIKNAPEHIQKLVDDSLLIGPERLKEALLSWASDLPKAKLSSEQQSAFVEILKSYINNDPTIFDKLTGDAFKYSTWLTHITKIYKAVHELAAPKITLTTTPMFGYSNYTNIGRQAMYAHIDHHEILSDYEYHLEKMRDPEKAIMMQASRKFSTGLYVMLGFEHVISKNKVSSDFKLVRRLVIDDQQVPLEIAKKKAEKAERETTLNLVYPLLEGTDIDGINQKEQEGKFPSSRKGEPGPMELGLGLAPPTSPPSNNKAINNVGYPTPPPAGKPFLTEKRTGQVHPPR